MSGVRTTRSQGKRGWEGDGEHLSFFRSDLEVGEVRGGGGPGSGAVDELSCVEDAGWGVDFDGVVEGASGEDGRVGAEVDGGGADGGEKCDGELARIEAVLVEEDEAVVAGGEGWEKAGEICRGEFVVRVWRVRAGRACRVVLVWKGTRMPERMMEAVEEVGVEGEAEVGEGTEGGWIVGIAGG